MLHDFSVLQLTVLVSHISSCEVNILWNDQSVYCICCTQACHVVSSDNLYQMTFYNWYTGQLFLAEPMLCSTHHGCHSGALYALPYHQNSCGKICMKSLAAYFLPICFPFHACAAVECVYAAHQLHQISPCQSPHLHLLHLLHLYSPCLKSVSFHDQYNLHPEDLSYSNHLIWKRSLNPQVALSDSVLYFCLNEFSHHECFSL